LSNTIFCVLTTPEGAPVEEASIQFRDENSVYPLPLKQGVGEFSLTPKKSNFNPTSYLLSYTLNLPSQKPLEGEIQLPLEKKAEHLLLALDKGIYQPGEDFEVTLHSTEKNTPIFLQWLQEGVLVLQGQAEPHFEGKRVWKGTLPLQISGTLVLKASQISAHGKWISTQRLAFIRPPEAHFQINVHSERHYFPTDTVPLSFSSHRRDQTPVSGSIAVSIVDEMVFALPSQNLAQLFYELEEQRRKSSVRSLALDPNAVRESLKTQVLEEAQQITAKAYYATQESTENSLDFGDLSHTHLISDPDQAKQILAAHLPEYLLDHSFLIEKNGKAEVDSQLFTRLIFKKNLPLDPFLQGRAFTIEEILPHLQTNPFRHCTQVSDLIRSTEEYRRQKLVQEFGKRNSHDEIIKKLQAQNKSTARAFTPLGIAIDLKAEAEEKLRSGFSWVAKEEAPSHEITEPEHTLIPPQLNQQAEGSPLKEKEADKKVLLPASSSTSSPPETQIDELEPPSGSEEEDSDPSTKALNEQKNSLWEKEIRTEEESSFSEAPISLEEEFEEEEEEEPGTFQDSIKDNDAREEQKKRDVLIDENKRGKGGKGDEIGGSNKDRKGGRQEQKAEKEKGDDKHKLLFPIPRGLQLRRFFPETLYFNGEIPLVEGKAKFEVRAPDSITEFRVQATLSSTEGALGFQQKSFKVYRPFFIDFNLPTTLTVGDTLHLPIVVHNGVEKNLFLKFHLKKQDWFEVISEESFKEENGFIVMDDEMKAKKVQTWVVPLRIVKAGKHLLKLVVHCPEEDLQSLKNLNLEERDLQDALEREIEIFPQGKKQTYSQNFLLSPSQEQNLRWSAPPEAIEEAQQRFLKVYPNLLSLLREEVLLENRTFGGLEQILNMGLPLVLLYRKIKETRPLTEEQELHLNALAQRILSYQNTEGFSAFRKGESDPVLTLFATYFLYHIEKLQSWKAEEEQEALSYRHKIFVLDSLSKSFSGFSPKEALKPLRQNPILYGSLAYLLLQEMGVSPQESTMIHIRQKLDKFSDIPSLPLRAFIAYALKEEEFFQDLFTFENLTLSEQLQLHALRLQSGCPQGKLMQQEDITFLLQHKKAEGYWEELLTNFVAMQALLQTSLPASPEKKGLEVTLNKERLDLQAGIIELIPLSSQESSWTLISNQPLFCQFVARYYTPWKLKEESASASPLKVSYEAVQKVKRERWFAKVEFTPEKGQIQTPLLLEIGIPPGFSVENTDSLLHKYPQWIQAIEPTETHVLVYLKPQEDLKETLKFDIRLQALLRLKVQAPVSAFRELTFHGKTGESGFLEAIDTSDSSSK
jgi:hypothetical protein